MVGLDLGAKRIGVAVCDAGRVLASPDRVLQRTGDETRDHQAIAAIVAEWDATSVVVGLPLSLDGSVGPAAQAALDEAERLAVVVPVPVETYDERLTTVSAERILAEQSVRGRARRQAVDKVAAAVILQSWLDRRTQDPT